MRTIVIDAALFSIAGGGAFAFGVTTAFRMASASTRGAERRS
jgi:hypothetical protein